MCEGLLTHRETAEALKTSERELYRLRVPRIRVGRQYRYVLAEVLKALRDDRERER